MSIAQPCIPIRVNHPRKLEAWSIPCRRIALGMPGDYKPSLALMPSGELVMAAFFQERLANDQLCEQTLLWRSSDGGKTWSPRRILEDVIGREQWLTCTRDGTLFMSSHLLEQDINNKDGYGHSYLHRSSDGGRTWQRQRVHLQGAERRGSKEELSTLTSRNILEMPDGTLLFGVSILDSGPAYLCSSHDGGGTWNHGEPVLLPDYHGRPYDNHDGFFCESFTYRAQAGKLLHWIRCGPPSPMYPMNDGRPMPQGNDQGDRTLICESTDGGKTWKNLRDWGDYGMMYPRLLRLRDGRLLATFTQRDLIYPFGLQAVISDDDGETWNFDADRIIIEGKTPWGQASGGGFGNTVQIADDTLVSAYTYRDAEGQTRLEIVRWAPP